MTMKKQEFRDMITEAITEMSDPNSEFFKIIEEGHTCANELKEHDPVLGGLVMKLCDSIDDLGKYIRSKGESSKV